MNDRRFPIMMEIDGKRRTEFLPWGMVEPFEQRAMKNHSQTLSELASRGGLGPYEARCLLRDEKLHGPQYELAGDDDYWWAWLSLRRTAWLSDYPPDAFEETNNPATNAG